MERKDVNINDVSPMMREYLKTKSEYEGIILFYRLGDFVYIMKMKNLGFDDYMCLKIAHAGCNFAPSIKTIK